LEAFPGAPLALLDYLPSTKKEGKGAHGQNAELHTSTRKNAIREKCAIRAK